MAATILDVNRVRCGVEFRRVFSVSVWCFCCCLIGIASASNDTFVPYDDNCSRHFEMAGNVPPRPFPPEFLRVANRTSVTFDVKACGDADVILHIADFQPQPEATRIFITLGKDNQSMSTIQVCGSNCVEARSEEENPLNCTEHVKLAVSWGNGGVNVFIRQEENDTWRKFLANPPTSTVPLKVHSVHVAYGLNKGDNANTTSEWTVYVPCPVEVPPDGPCEEFVDSSSMVTRAHLAGAVIAALLAGIICGVLCVRYAPRLITWIRGRLAAGREKSREGAQTGEELSSLVAPQSPDKPQTPAASPSPSPEAQETKVDLTLPGDNPPPAAAPDPKRKASSNTYTPYHEMGGSAAAPAAKKDDVTAESADVSGSRPRKKKSLVSGAGIAASPLPALPGDDVQAAAAAPTTLTSGPEDVYINADVHIYEGMHHDAPIYENRNTGFYEALQPSAKEK